MFSARTLRTASITRRAVALALAGTLLGAGGALAGNGAETTHFTAAYSSFTCAGERIVKTTPKAFTKDSETCTFTDLSEFPPGTYAIIPRSGPKAQPNPTGRATTSCSSSGSAGPELRPDRVPVR